MYFHTPESGVRKMLTTFSVVAVVASTKGHFQILKDHIDACARITLNPSRQYDSLSQLWVDWTDRIAELDSTGAGWRCSYSASEKKNYSRVKQVFTGMKEYIKRHHHGETSTPKHVIDLLDARFQQLKRSVPRMIEWMQQEGYLHKGKGRGRLKKHHHEN
jgi:hypothetical protein